MERFFANGTSIGQSMSCQGDNSAQAHSHTMASTSPKCGFLELHKELDDPLVDWNLEEEGKNDRMTTPIDLSLLFEFKVCY